MPGPGPGRRGQAWWLGARACSAGRLGTLIARAAGRWAKVAEVSRKVLGWRLRLLPYLYTAHFQAHARGCPVARPLFAAFPADAGVRNLAGQWMTGDALMVSPVLAEGATAAAVYFPEGTWFNLYSSAAVVAPRGGRNVTLQARFARMRPPTRSPWSDPALQRQRMHLWTARRSA